MQRVDDPIRVLIVDDDPDALVLLKHHLTSRGYSVRTAGDGDTALQRIREETPQLVLADWMMTGVDGLSLVRLVRQSPELPYIYFILISGRSDKSDVAQGLDAGADDFLAKPIDERELHARLKAAERIILLEALHRRHAQRLQKASFETSLLNDRIRRLTDEVRAARHRAEAARASRRALLADMSHEIRSPMNAILGYAEMLRSQGDLSKAPPQRVEAVETILRNCQHILDRVNDVLDLTRLDAGKLQPQWSDASPGEIAREVRTLFMRRAEEKHLKLDVEIGRDVPQRLRCDPRRLRQILINLVANAVKFTDQGGICISVDYRAVPDDTSVLPSATGRLNEQPRRIGELTIRVSDTGHGISTNVLAGVFTPFERGEAADSGDRPGTGLGLFLSRKLARLLGGELDAVSQIGEGSTFTLTLPIEHSTHTGRVAVIPPTAPASAVGDDAPDRSSELGQQHFRMHRNDTQGGAMNTTCHPKPANLVSSYADDADMRELVESYVHELPSRAAAIQRAYQREDLETLGRLVHQLKGSAGGYGFAPITEAAKSLDECVKARKDLQSMRAQVERLTELCRQARATRKEH